MSKTRQSPQEGRGAKIQPCPWPSASKPRRWQAEALPLALASVSRGHNGLVRACTGAGKAGLLAQVARCVLASEARGVVVVSTPTERLVRQLVATLERWVEPSSVGEWWGGQKRLAAVVVTCNPSLSTLASELLQRGLGVSVWILDEAHTSESPEVKRVAGLPVFAQAPRLGFTATPYRARADEGLSLFDHELYDYDLPAALKDGVVVPWSVVQWKAGDVPLDDACEAMCRAAVERGLGPGLVDAAFIEDAEAFARRLRGAGIEAAAVHSGLSEEVIDDLAAKLKDGELDVLVHVAMLKEGVDWPWLRWLCLRRKVASLPWLVQHVGRVLRVYPGKKNAVIFDPHDLLGAMPLVGNASKVGAQNPTARAGEGREREGGEREGSAQHKAAPLGEYDQRLRALVYRLEQDGKLRRKATRSEDRAARVSTETLARMVPLARTLARSKAAEADLDVLREGWGARLALTEGAGLDWIIAATALV